MNIQLFVKIESQKQNVISNLFQDLKFVKKTIFQLLKYVFEKMNVKSNNIKKAPVYIVTFKLVFFTTNILEVEK